MGFLKSQWKSIRTSNAIERLHEEFKRRIKIHIVPLILDKRKAFGCFAFDQELRGLVCMTTESAFNGSISPVLGFLGGTSTKKLALPKSAGCFRTPLSATRRPGFSPATVVRRPKCLR
jgi:hypothetical protein